jgi:hypothetical protein
MLNHLNFRTFRLLPVLVLAAFSSMVATATTSTFSTAPGAVNGSANGVNASAQFTTGAGQIVIVLSNLLTANQVLAINQNISDLEFTVSNGFTGTVTDANRSYTGSLVDVDASGNVTAAAGTFNGWDFSNSGSAFTLEELGSAQGNNQTIVGGAGAASYPNANSSITNGHGNPLLQGSATFTLTGLTGVTAATTITAATFSFGTALGDTVPGQSVVPEPKEAAVVLLGFLAVFIAHRRRLSQSRNLA